MDGFWRVLRFIVRGTRRLAILVVGLVVMAVGVVLIPAPGPGGLVIVAGLAILATEFTWAEILLERTKRQATRAKDLAVQKAMARRRARGPAPTKAVGAGDAVGAGETIVGAGDSGETVGAVEAGDAVDASDATDASDASDASDAVDAGDGGDPEDAGETVKAGETSEAVGTTEASETGEPSGRVLEPEPSPNGGQVRGASTPT